MKPEAFGQPISYRGVLYLLTVGLVLVAAQGILLARYWPQGYGPDLVLLVVVYMGLYAPLLPGATLGIFLGFLKDAAGGGLMGMNAGIFLVIFLPIHFTRRHIEPTTAWHQFVLVLIVTGAGGLLAMGLLHMFGWRISMVPENIYSPVAAYVVSSLITAALGPPFFWIVNIFRPSDITGREQES